MRELFEVRVNRKPILVTAATSVAAAIFQSGVVAFRFSPGGISPSGAAIPATARGPLCGMGICAECRATINGVAGELSCQRMCQPGMEVETEAASNQEIR